MPEAACRTRSNLLCGIPALALLAGAWAPEAAAQTRSEEAAPSTGEIVVTAQKREEALSDVPLSVTAATAETLADYGITDVSELGKIVPGFTYQLSTFGVPVYTLRGVGFYERSVGSSPAVSIYVDQVPLTYAVTTRGAAPSRHSRPSAARPGARRPAPGPPPTAPRGSGGAARRSAPRPPRRRG